MSESTSPSFSHQADPHRRARLRWRARRGLLENDIIVERFFNRYEQNLSDEDVASLSQLFELSDNELMDLLLARKELDGELDTPPMRHVISLLRSV
ncbi:succinate dehydrogenase assembly factor 2 [Cupriavidus sp. WS]|uniref:FAD assembly factor SdhE n=1 Tax=Cupriavidus sp. WS TaxID=1312922 RepID=UPI00049208A0|nr:succinate dehydrogenase assembly factor 2 [Cupriavidus sp. WS]